MKSLFSPDNVKEEINSKTFMEGHKSYSRYLGALYLARTAHMCVYISHELKAVFKGLIVLLSIDRAKRMLLFLFRSTYRQHSF